MLAVSAAAEAATAVVGAAAPDPGVEAVVVVAAAAVAAWVALVVVEDVVAVAAGDAVVAFESVVVCSHWSGDLGRRPFATVVLIVAEALAVAGYLPAVQHAAAWPFAVQCFDVAAGRDVAAVVPCSFEPTAAVAAAVA